MFEFRVVAQDDMTGARAGVLSTPHGEIETPVFMPVGTQATVKTLAPFELKEIGAKIILANAYHLYLRPGAEVVKAAGGLHSFMGWDGAILTDSGGFQIWSISRLNRVRDEGLEFQSHLDGSRHFMSPESNVQLQRDIGSDIMMALDECVAYPSERSYAETSADLTLRWAKRAREEWADRPGKQALFGIVQGATYEDLRRSSAQAIAEMDFPGHAIGGLAVGEPKSAMREMVDVVIGELPPEKPRYFMGQGFPEDIVGSVAQGVDMFDCVMPTRNARKGTLFTSKGRLVVKNATHARDFEPIDDSCPCYACREFSRGYLRHLFNSEETLAGRLATVHNLTFYVSMMREMREAIMGGRFVGWRRDFLEKYHGGSGADDSGEADTGRG